MGIETQTPELLKALVDRNQLQEGQNTARFLEKLVSQENGENEKVKNSLSVKITVQYELELNTMAKENYAGSGKNHVQSKRNVRYGSNGDGDSLVSSLSPSGSFPQGSRVEKQPSSREWLEQCQQTYQREFPKLQAEHPSEFVAIDGRDVVEIGMNERMLFEKYLGYSRRVEIFNIPQTVPFSSRDVELLLPNALLD